MAPVYALPAHLDRLDEGCQPLPLPVAAAALGQQGGVGLGINNGEKEKDWVLDCSKVQAKPASVRHQGLKSWQQDWEGGTAAAACRARI